MQFSKQVDSTDTATHAKQTRPSRRVTTAWRQIRVDVRSPGLVGQRHCAAQPAPAQFWCPPVAPSCGRDATQCGLAQAGGSMTAELRIISSMATRQLLADLVADFESTAPQRVTV